MQRTAVGVVVWLLVLNALVKPAWLIAENSVQNHLGHELFGAFAAVWQLAFICAALLDVGTTLAATQQAATLKTGTGQHLLRATLGLRVLLGLVYAVALPAAAWSVGFSAAQWQLVGLLGAYHLGIGTLLFSRALHQGRQRFYFDGILGVLDKLLLLVFVYAIVLQMPPSATTYARWALASVLVPLAVALGVLVWRGPWLTPRIDPTAIGKALKTALPFAAMAALVALNERMTTLVLERTVGSREAGFYAAAYRWIAAAQMYLWTVAPVFFARFAKGGAAVTKPQLREAYVLLGLPVAAGAAVLITHAEAPLQLLTASSIEERREIARLLQVLGLGLVPLAVATPFGTYVSARGHAGRLAWVLVPATLLHGGLLAYATLANWSFAASAYTVFQLTAAGLYLWVYTRVARSPIPVRWVAQTLVAAGAGVGTGVALQFLAVHWALSASGVGVVVLLLGGATGFLQKLVNGAQPFR